MDKDSLIKIYTSDYDLDGGNKIPKDDMYYSYYQSEAAKKLSKPPYNTLYDGLELSRCLLQKVGAEEDPTNFLLMHAMGPNVAGVIGTAVAAGVFMAIFGV